MELTRSQKMYASVLGVALVGLALDQSLLSPGAASANAEAVAAVVDAATTAVAPDAFRVPEVPEVSLPGSSIADRFTRILQEHDLDAENVPDAFRPAESWMPRSTAVEPVAVDDGTAAQTALRFVQQHRLQAVIAKAVGGLAIVDGRRLEVGDSVGGFRLVEVVERAAVFEDQDGVRARLELPGRTE